MARLLIGTGTTDSNGRVTVSYSGKGAGKLQLVAVNGNLLSEIYELYDTIWCDIGTSTNYNDSGWSTWSSYLMSRTRNADYTLLEKADSSTTGYQIRYLSTLTNPHIIEYDAKQVGGVTSSIVFQLRGNNQSVVKQVALSNFSGAAIDTWYHYKIDLDNKTWTNTTLNKTVTFDDGFVSFFFMIGSTEGHTIHYRNFMVY